MTILERVKSIVDSNLDITDESPASIEKMIYMAYFIGREEADRSVSDMYNKHISEQRQRARECRYRHMAEAVVGPEEYLYSADYAQEMTGLFGSDLADV